MKKLNPILKLKSSDAQRINLTFVPYSFLANFVNYIFAKVVFISQCYHERYRDELF